MNSATLSRGIFALLLLTLVGCGGDSAGPKKWEDPLIEPVDAPKGTNDDKPKSVTHVQSPKGPLPWPDKKEKQVNKIYSPVHPSPRPLVTNRPPFDWRDLQKPVRRAQHLIKRCYENMLKSNPNLEGKLALVMTLGSDGLVDKVEITHDDLGDDTSGCIVRVIGALQFPPSPENGYEPRRVSTVFMFRKN